MTKNITVECGSIVCTSTVKRGEDNAHIKMTLQDVRIHELMANLIESVGSDVILDHLTDSDIQAYLKGGE